MPVRSRLRSRNTLLSSSQHFVDIASEEVKQECARNYVHPVYAPTEEEELVRVLLLIRAHLEKSAREGPADQVPQPGTTAWVKNVVEKVLRPGERKSHTYPSILGSLPAYTLVSHLESFAYFRGAGMIKVKTMASMLAGASRAKGKVSPVGLVSNVSIIVPHIHGD